MYPLCKKKTLTVSCTLVCESGDRVKADQSSFSSDLHAVMLRHHCSEYDTLLLHCAELLRRNIITYCIYECQKNINA